MKVVILAGGFGTRLSEYTKTIPKPMVIVNNKPIIIHIMQHYAKYGFKEFCIATGYKSHILKKYFKNNKKFKDWSIKLIYTGLHTMTGGRIKRLKKIIGNETFMFTYGDGVSNINLKKLLSFHKKNKKILTITAVRPPARFGALKVVKNKVKYFKEKSNLDEGWINGGFFVSEPKIFNFIKDDKTYLERTPFERICKKNQMVAFKHNSFWQCMDSQRDKEILEKKLKKIKL